MSEYQRDATSALPASEPQARSERARGSELVGIVRDFITVHREMQRLFGHFRDGTLRFADVRSLVADGESSALYRLKERVHALFRNESDDSSLQRGEALFDLAVGSLFHEALKFRENFYQLEVYGPKVLRLRREAGEDADELLTEFEKILGGASARLGESLEEADTLLEQTRRQLLVLLVGSRSKPCAGLVTRYLIGHRDEVEAVYPEGLEALLVRLHGDIFAAYRCAIHSQLESARFKEVLELIDEVAGSTAVGGDAGATRSELRRLEAYARGMQAFLEGDYGETTARLAAWLEGSGTAAEPAHLKFALAALRRIPDLVGGKPSAAVATAATELAERLEVSAS
jgi:hypothetical protein